MFISPVSLSHCQSLELSLQQASTSQQNVYLHRPHAGTSFMTAASTSPSLVHAAGCCTSLETAAPLNRPHHLANCLVCASATHVADWSNNNQQNNVLSVRCTQMMPDVTYHQPMLAYSIAQTDLAAHVDNALLLLQQHHAHLQHARPTHCHQQHTTNPIKANQPAHSTAHTRGCQEAPSLNTTCRHQPTHTQPRRSTYQSVLQPHLSRTIK